MTEIKSLYPQVCTLLSLEEVSRSKYIGPFWIKPQSFPRYLGLKGAQFTISDKLLHSESPQNAYSMKISLRAQCFTIPINSSWTILFATVDGDNF